MDTRHWPDEQDIDVDELDPETFERELLEHARADYAELRELNAA